MDVKEKDLADARKKLTYFKEHWTLTADGDVFNTPSSLLQPVIYKGFKAILKIPVVAEERLGSLLMVCWNGEGAAKVYEHDENALLMERAAGKLSLKQMVRNGNEDMANRIICDVAAKLHKVSCKNIALIPLPVWFRALGPASDKFGGILVDCNEAANQLLTSMTETVVLHGDLHYDNILDSGTRGWMAIDPKGLKGERAFDFSNLFCNPDIKVAASPSRLAKQVKFITEAADLAPRRLLKWIIAWAGLSAVWILNDGEDAELPLTVAKIALNELLV